MHTTKSIQSHTLLEAIASYCKPENITNTIPAIFLLVQSYSTLSKHTTSLKYHACIPDYSHGLNLVSGHRVIIP